MLTIFLILFLFPQFLLTLPPSTCSILFNQGYNCIEHNLITPDGYILTVHHITSSPVCSRSLHPTPILLQHGLFDTSATFVLNNPNQNLANLLSDNCYDVFLANSRGNRYSTAHTTFPINSPEYWAFDWDQLAQYDLPSTIDLVLSLSNSPNVTLIAHSQGATISFAALSKNFIKPSKINRFIALAPVTWLGSQKSNLLLLLSQVPEAILSAVVGDEGMSFSPEVISSLLGGTCNLFPSLCTNVAASLFGPSLPSNVNSSRVTLYSTYWPDQTSVRTMIHWFRNTQTGNFANFNGTLYTPTSIISTPIAIYYGDNDYLSDPTDVLILWNQINPILRLTAAPVFVSGYSHMDFTWSYKAVDYVYVGILKMI